MSDQLATIDNAAEVVASVPSTTTLTLARQVQDMADAHTLASAFVNTAFAGSFKGKLDDLAVAILKGNSIGIPAHEVGGKIYTVHGTPALYGKTALAIAKAHGYRFERVTYSPKEVTVKASAPSGDSDTVSYTYARAEKEGLVKGNKAQYETRPAKMLWWKCIGELADQFFPHLLSGMPIKEDWEQSQPIRATAERIDTPRDVAAIVAPPTSSPVDSNDSVPSDEVSEPVESTDDLDAIFAMIQSAQSMDELEAMKPFIQSHLSSSPGDREAVNSCWMTTQSGLMS